MVTILTDPTNPVDRNYDKTAKNAVVVVARQVFYDEGYRVAEEGEKISLSDADFALLHDLGQVEPA